MWKLLARGYTGRMLKEFGHNRISDIISTLTQYNHIFIHFGGGTLLHRFEVFIELFIRFQKLSKYA